MKKTSILLSFFIIIFSNSIYSQTEIGSFLGVKLGQSYAEVKRIIQYNYFVSTAGQNAKIEYNPTSIRLLHFDVDFLNHLWPNVTFEFKDDKLVEGSFYDFEGRDIQSSETAENNYNTQVYKNYFNEVVSLLTLKYSEPAITNPYDYVWVDKNRNSLTFRIKFANQTWHHPADNHLETMSTAEVFVIYKSSLSLENY